MRKILSSVLLLGIFLFTPNSHSAVRLEPLDSLNLIKIHQVENEVNKTLPLNLRQSAQYLKLYLFNQKNNLGLVDPNSARLVHTMFIGVKEVKEDDVLNMSSFRESPVFLAYLYRGDILKMDIQYTTQFPELNTDSAIRVGHLSYILFPIVYNHERLIGFGVLNFSTDIRYEMFTDIVINLSNKLSVILNEG